jgi:hypothetical protein
MPNAETVPKKQIKPIPQGSWRLGDWVSDSWGIGVIGFFVQFQNLHYQDWFYWFLHSEYTSKNEYKQKVLGQFPY